jgi:hypothetical protein
MGHPSSWQGEFLKTLFPRTLFGPTGARRSLERDITLAAHIAPAGTAHDQFDRKNDQLAPCRLLVSKTLKQ